MSIRRAFITTVKLAALAVVLVSSIAHASQYAHRPAETVSGMSTVRGAANGFRISGHVKNLYPGKAAKLTAIVRNLNRVPIRVTRIRAKVTGVAGCPAKRFKIKPFKGKRRVGPRRAVKVKLKITMRSNAPNGCRGARVHLTYRGKAVRA